MSGKAAKKAPKRKGAYKLPDPIKAGEILTDMTKKQWILGVSIGMGGFGEIYSAAPYSEKSVKEYPNVIKIEPHGNGPLFVEMHFYMRNAKADEIDAWRKKKKLSSLGMPKYIGSGSHEYNNTKYRFVVMDRYSTDLWKLFEESNRRFPEHTVYKIAYQIVNVLEYIHHKTYVHADIKGANLLLGLKNPNQVYLVDFGLASHYTTKDEYKYDPKKAHNGTIEYTSRDAHHGVPTMRGDFEILAYNIIQWLSGSLLWEKNLTSPAAVQKRKEDAFNNVQDFLNKSFQSTVPEPVLKYTTLLATLKFNDTPDYDKFRKILTDGLKELGHKPDGKLEFKSDKQVLSPSPPKVKKIAEPKKAFSRLKQLKSASPAKVNLNDSNVGIVLDKKRGGMKDIQEVLNNIESDEEYDIKIVKKARVPKTISKSPKSPKVVKTPNSTPNKKTVTRRRVVKKTSLDDSDSESSKEVISKGTKSRPARRAATRAKPKASSPTSASTNSDEDMFE